MKQYSIKDRLLTALAVVLVLGDIALGALIWQREREEQQESLRNSIPFTNQCIEWTGAGYQQIGGGAND